jgi:hypothetical protein
MATERKREFASIKDYARLRKVQPQLVYYYIRKDMIEIIPCGCCGAKVISIDQADRVIGR